MAQTTSANTFSGSAWETYKVNLKDPNFKDVPFNEWATELWGIENPGPRAKNELLAKRFVKANVPTLKRALDLTFTFIDNAVFQSLSQLPDIRHDGGRRWFFNAFRDSFCTPAASQVYCLRTWQLWHRFAPLLVDRKNACETAKAGAVQQWWLEGQPACDSTQAPSAPIGELQAHPSPPPEYVLPEPPSAPNGPTALPTPLDDPSWMESVPPNDPNGNAAGAPEDARGDVQRVRGASQDGRAGQSLRGISVSGGDGEEGRLGNGGGADRVHPTPDGVPGEGGMESRVEEVISLDKEADPPTVPASFASSLMDLPPPSPTTIALVQGAFREGCDGLTMLSQTTDDIDLWNFGPCPDPVPAGRALEPPAQEVPSGRDSNGIMPWDTFFGASNWGTLGLESW